MKKIIVVISLFFLLFITSCKKTVIITLYLNGEPNTYQVERNSTFIIPSFKAPEGYTWSFPSKEIKVGKEDIKIDGLLTERMKHVLYIMDDKVIKEEDTLFTKGPNYPELPEYVAQGYKWNLTKDIREEEIIFTYTLQYRTRKMMVIYLDTSGNEIFTEYVSYGEKANGVKVEPNYQCTYSHDLSKITSDLEVTVTYTKTYGKVKFYSFNDEIDLGLSSYQFGERVSLPNPPEKEGYKFIGWFLDDISLYPFKEISSVDTEDFIFHARYIKTIFDEIALPEATYHFSGIKAIPHSSNPNLIVYQPVFPTDAPLGATSYLWETSDSNIAKVSIYSTITPKAAGICVLKATNKDNPNITINCLIQVTDKDVRYITLEDANKHEFFKVTYKGRSNDIISEQLVPKFGTAVNPIPYKYDGFYFTGWDKANYGITSDTVITATYKEGVDNFTGKKVSIIGDSITTFEGFIPQGNKSFYPYPTADFHDVNCTWWMQVINKLGAGLLFNNSWSGSCVWAHNESDAYSNTRISQLYKGEVYPDMIISFMGNNDAAINSISSEDFYTGYKLMVEEILSIMPNVKFYILALPISKIYSEDRRILFNKEIAKLCKDLNLNLVDLSSLDISSNLIDSAHPKLKGMSLIAEKVYEEIIK